MSLKRQTIILILGRLIALISTFFLPVLLVRLISKGNFGIYQQFNNLTLIFKAIIPFGLSSSLLYHFPNLEEQNKKLFIFQTNTLLIVFSFLGAIGIFFSGKLLFSSMQTESYTFLKVMLPISLFLLSSTTAIDYIFIVEHNNVLLFWVPIFEAFLRTLLVLGGAYFLNDFRGAVVGFVFYALVQFLFYQFYSMKKYKCNFKEILNIKLPDIKKELTYSLPFGFAVLFSTLSNRIDKVYSIYFLTEEQYALYAVAFYSIPFISIFFDSIFKTAIPVLSRYYANNEIHNASHLYRSIVTKISSCVIPVVVFVFIFAADIIVLLFTDAYSASTNYYRMYICTIFIIMLGPGIVLRSFDKTKYSMHYQFIAALIVIPLGYFLVKHFLIYGAMISSILGISIPCFLQLEHERKLLKLKRTEWLPWKNLFKISISSLLLGYTIREIFKFISQEIYFLLISFSLYIFFTLLWQIKTHIFCYPEVINILKKRLRIISL